jgi:antitoxin component YwqK of YwqJK toxin-antitoxin module
MKIIITEEQKKKLFIPRRLSGEDSRWVQWNKDQPIVDGVQINQYTHDGLKTGMWEEHYDDDGNLWARGSYVDGMRDGNWEYYYDDGNGELRSVGSYKNDMKSGVWEYYGKDGKLQVKTLYSNGNLIKKIPLTESETPKKKLFVPRRLSGENSRYPQWNKDQPIVDGIQINQYDMEGLKQGYWEEYDGDNMEKGNYVDGKEEGIWEYYYSNGNLMSKGSYKGGKADGIWEYYFRNGNLRFKQLYKLVKELPLTESETPKKKLFVPRRLSGENSKWMEWNKMQPEIDGVKINQYTHDGKKNGIWEEYDEYDGSFEKGSYKNGLKQGYWEFYDENGELYKKGLYKNDKKDGIWEKYDENGQLHKKVSYKNDGNLIETELYENGQLFYKFSYNNDKADGIWEFYNKNGSLREKRLYDNGKLVKQLPIKESETPKKKLFIPRKIDEREDQLKAEIKKFLNKIKDSDVWDILGKLDSSYDYDSDYYETLYYDKNNKVITPVQIANFYKEKYDKETANEMIMSFYEKTGDISDFMIGVMSSGNNISFVWSEIINLGDGKLEYREHISKRYEGNDEYFEEENYRVVSL